MRVRMPYTSFQEKQKCGTKLSPSCCEGQLKCFKKTEKYTFANTKQT